MKRKPERISIKLFSGIICLVFIIEMLPSMVFADSKSGTTVRVGYYENEVTSGRHERASVEAR